MAWNSFALRMISISLKGISLSLLFLFISCSSKTAVAIKPELDYSVQDKYLQNLKPIFAALSPGELRCSWGKEYQIGLAFAKKLDLFQAITSFKRADILIPENLFQRKAEIQYQIINCYYLGKKYYDVIDVFEDSLLASTTRNFEGFHDLLIMLFEAYQRCDRPERAEWIVHTMRKFYPDVAKKLELSSYLYTADLFNLTRISISDDGVQNADEEDFAHYTNCLTACKAVVDTYNRCKKNPSLAGALNAFLPGAGYLYLGQKQSAFTSFSLNGLFIGAASYFFIKGNIPAGLITLGFESGWYLGGIVGAKEGARLYNERLYETHAHTQMRDHKLYPILMLNHGF